MRGPAVRQKIFVFSKNSVSVIYTNITINNIKRIYYWTKILNFLIYTSSQVQVIARMLNENTQFSGFYCSVSYVSVPQATRSSVFLIIPQLPAVWCLQCQSIHGLMTGGLRWACEHYRMIHYPRPRLWAQMIKWCQNAAWPPITRHRDNAGPGSD